MRLVHPTRNAPLARQLRPRWPSKDSSVHETAPSPFRGRIWPPFASGETAAHCDQTAWLYSSSFGAAAEKFLCLLVLKIHVASTHAARKQHAIGVLNKRGERLARALYFAVMGK